MHKPSAEMADFVTDGLKFWQKLVDTKRAECVAALDGADESADLEGSKYEPVSRKMTNQPDRNYARILRSKRAKMASQNMDGLRCSRLKIS